VEEIWDVEESVDEVMDRAHELPKLNGLTAGINPPTQSPSIMTADTGLETQGKGLDRAQTVCNFDFGNLFVKFDGGLMDKDTSMASKEILAWWSAQGHEETLTWWSAQGGDWEPH
jgi:hypothetical protein